MAHSTALTSPTVSNILAGDEFASSGSTSGPTTEAAALHRTVVFTDVIDSTTLIDTLGDDEWLKVVHAHHALAWELGRRLGAEHVKSTGDGVFAVFGDPDSAIVFAAQMIKGMEAAAADDRCVAIGLKVGIAAGPVHRMFGDYHGRTMHLAARLCAAAGRGGVLLSAACRETLAGAPAVFGQTTRIELRGFGAESVLRLRVEPDVIVPAAA